MLAARCRPAFMVLAKGDRDDLRPLSLFALGDQADADRRPSSPSCRRRCRPDLAAHYPDTRKLGPLGWIYRHVLVSITNAADLAGQMDDHPAAQPRDAAPVPYLVSVYRPDRQDPGRLSPPCPGDGTRARGHGPGVVSSAAAAARR